MENLPAAIDETICAICLSTPNNEVECWSCFARYCMSCAEGWYKCKVTKKSCAYCRASWSKYRSYHHVETISNPTERIGPIIAKTQSFVIKANSPGIVLKGPGPSGIRKPVRTNNTKFPAVQLTSGAPNLGSNIADPPEPQSHAPIKDTVVKKSSEKILSTAAAISYLTGVSEYLIQMEKRETQVAQLQISIQTRDESIRELNLEIQRLKKALSSFCGTQ